jgi:hypothetical protein
MRASSVPARAQESRAVNGYRPADRLHELARAVRQIGTGHRCDPERIAIAKDEIAHELVILARRLDGGRR